ncbi:DNA adenine methylase [Micromonospora sp. NPDC005174]|uniref:DNA adenine methylase n=1 Tax=Micromonospora sp. NPDC005174 TaxID=3157018 RepID=UPI0033AEFFDE
MKPPFPYAGAKGAIADRIVSLLPEHVHYVEPYAGSLAVLLAKPPVRMETVNDLDHDVVTFFRVLRDRPKELARACKLTPHSRAEYVDLRTSPIVGDEIEVARRVWVLLTQGRGGTLGSLTGWRHFVQPRGSSIGMPAYQDGYVARMEAVSERLHAVSLECMPALDLIVKYGVDEEVLLYVDPPYLGSTRGVLYRHEMKSDAEHRELAEVLNDCRAAVVLSGYTSALYDELYAGWHRLDLPTMTGNGRDGAKSRTEVLWSNRPLSAKPSLFDAWGAAS